MTDTCKHCTVRGNIVTCRAIPCHTHDSWYAQQQDAEIRRLNENLHLFVTEARTNHNNWAAAVREKDAEIERLREALERMLSAYDDDRLFSDDPIEVTSARAVLALKEKDDV